MIVSDDRNYYLILMEDFPEIEAQKDIINKDSGAHYYGILLYPMACQELFKRPEEEMYL